MREQAPRKTKKVSFRPYTEVRMFKPSAGRLKYVKDAYLPTKTGSAHRPCEPRLPPWVALSAEDSAADLSGLPELPPEPTASEYLKKSRLMLLADLLNRFSYKRPVAAASSADTARKSGRRSSPRGHRKPHTHTKSKSRAVAVAQDGSKQHRRRRTENERIAERLRHVSSFDGATDEEMLDELVNDLADLDGDLAELDADIKDVVDGVSRRSGGKTDAEMVDGLANDLADLAKLDADIKDAVDSVSCRSGETNSREARRKKHRKVMVELMHDNSTFYVRYAN